MNSKIPQWSNPVETSLNKPSLVRDGRSLQHGTISLWANSQVLPSAVFSGGWGRWGLKPLHKWAFCVKTTSVQCFLMVSSVSLGNTVEYGAACNLWAAHGRKTSRSNQAWCFLKPQFVSDGKHVTEDRGVKDMIRPCAQFICSTWQIGVWNSQHVKMSRRTLWTLGLWTPTLYFWSKVTYV